MYCSRCGKQNDDGASFCSGCGTALNSGFGQYETNTPPAVGNEQTPKKKTGFLTKLLIGIAVFVACYLAANAIAGLFVEDALNDQPTASTMSNGEALESSSAFRKIFSERNIIRMDAFFPGMESAAYARVGENGTVECMEIGYIDDIIHSVEQTIYIDTTATTQEKLDQTNAFFMPYDAMENVTVTVTPGSGYYTIRIRMDNLNNTTNLKAVIDAKLLSVQNPTGLLSASGTQSALLGNGYVKK